MTDLPPWAATAARHAADLEAVAAEVAAVFSYTAAEVETAGAEFAAVFGRTGNEVAVYDPDWVREILDGPSTSERWTVPDPQEPPA